MALKPKTPKPPKGEFARHSPCLSQNLHYYKIISEFGGFVSPL